MGAKAKEVIDIETKKPVKRKHRPKTAKELEASSTLNFDDCESSLDRLHQIQTMLLSTMKIGEGLYREHPTQSNAYSLSNMIDKYQSISDQIYDSIDYEELTEDCMLTIINPFIESLVLELGKTIRIELRDNLSKLKPKAKQRVKTSLDDIFKRFGMISESKLKELQVDLFEFMES